MSTWSKLNELLSLPEADRVQLHRVCRVAGFGVRVQKSGQATGQEGPQHRLQANLRGQQCQCCDREHGEPDPGLSPALGLRVHRLGDPPASGESTDRPRGPASQDERCGQSHSNRGACRDVAYRSHVAPCKGTPVESE